MSAVDMVRSGWSRFVDWRRHARARQQALRSMAFMTSRDLADIGMSRSAMEFHLNSGSSFLSRR